MSKDIPGENKRLVVKALRSEIKTLEDEIFKYLPKEEQDKIIDSLRGEIQNMRERIRNFKKN